MSKVIEFPADRITKGVHTYFPEMKERKVNAQIEAILSHYGNHYFIDTQLELKGRGISFLKIYVPDDFIRPSHKAGWHSYKVTSAAFEKLKEQYSISMERILD
ncbi:hypothetical protein BK133_11310 [Paenibacillus sp. FSL H8-0548]|nr:hypothetical protein BK133_11310 [Paenibacillus sp. FSL H8-0548]